MKGPRIRLQLCAAALAITSLGGPAHAAHCKKVPPPTQAPVGAGEKGGRWYVGGQAGGSYLFADGSVGGVRVYGYHAGQASLVAPHVVYVGAGPDELTGCAHPPS